MISVHLAAECDTAITNSAWSQWWLDMPLVIWLVLHGRFCMVMLRTKPTNYLLDLSLIWGQKCEQVATSWRNISEQKCQNPILDAVVRLVYQKCLIWKGLFASRSCMLQLKGLKLTFTHSLRVFSLYSMNHVLKMNVVLIKECIHLFSNTKCN